MAALCPLEMITSAIIAVVIGFCAEGHRVSMEEQGRTVDEES
jgi:hypothetical protein